MRRTKASLIYRRTKNLRAVQLLLGHSKLESTVRYLGIEVRRRPGDGGTDRGLGLKRVAAWPDWSRPAPPPLELGTGL
jgi:integrase